MANKTKKKRKRKLKIEQRDQLGAEKSQTKKIRHNTAVNQEKHRLDWQPLDPNEEGEVLDRRIMPRDELDRRKGLLTTFPQTFQAELGDVDWQNMADETPFLLGVVVEVSRGLCRVSVNDAVMTCDIRGILTAEGSGYSNLVAVGDRVLVRLHAEERGLIENVLPRRSGLARADSFLTHLRQIIAANIDQVLIVASWRDPHIWFQMIDEYLIGAARNNLDAVICINKVDLAFSVDEVKTAVSTYHDLDHRLLFTSAEQGMGIESLQTLLQGKTTVLAGLSGVGKSSLLNAVVPGFELRTKHTSIKRHEGRHTTTQALMLPLPFGGYVVDTPGIRDMGVNGLHPDDLIEHYPDVADYFHNCRFHDCTHSHEPGCAVKTAVSHGNLAEWRVKNYVKLYNRLDEAL
ncbi:MAG: ribosome small subunit-dependent GTPase A [Chloroflexi bacterium]|nr:ribosome small subunit-dependent GTPase A [Chloroflexota bacterium]